MPFVAITSPAIELERRGQCPYGWPLPLDGAVGDRLLRRAPP